MPPEYCSYGPDFETHCRPWLKKSHPKLYEILHVVASSTSSTSSSADDPTIDAAVVSSDPNAATAPWTTRERLAAFYAQYMPDKLDGIDAILEKYEGKEDKLFLALVKKYGPEPDDPYYANDDNDSDDDNDESDDDDEVSNKLNGLDMNNKANKKERRGASAKKVIKTDTRIIIQKISRNRKKAVTHVVGLDTVPGMKLKDAAKAFSKRFAGSSSVKDKEIIIQGDHVEDVAEMIVSKFGVQGDAVFFDLDGEFVPYGG